MNNNSEIFRMINLNYPIINITERKQRNTARRY